MRKTDRIVMQDGNVYPLYSQLEITTSRRVIKLNELSERLFVTSQFLCPGIGSGIVPFLRNMGVENKKEIDEALADFWRQYAPIGRETFSIHKLEPLIRPGESYTLPDLWGFNFTIEVNYKMERDLIHTFHKGWGMLSEYVSDSMRDYCNAYALTARLKRDRKFDAYNFARLWMRLHGMDYDDFTQDKRKNYENRFFQKPPLGGYGCPRYIKRKDKAIRRDTARDILVFFGMGVALEAVIYYVCSFLFGQDWGSFLMVIIPLLIILFAFYYISGD